MTRFEFIESLHSPVPPDHMIDLLMALWWDRKGDWDRAHSIAQIIHTKNGSRVHAYLHRVEGDRWNAEYWYRRTGLSYPDRGMSLEEEWEILLNEWTDG